MKKSYTLKTLFYLSFFALLFACKKMDNPVDFKEPSFTQGNLVLAGFTGRITDNGNVPISGASIVVGDKTATTDINGQFTINDASVSSNTALLKVTKSGFFAGYRTLLVKAGGIYSVSMVLISKGTSQSFSAATGGNINLGTGCNVQFQSNAVVVQSSGVAYSGAVKVFGFFLNPADANFNAYMPGDLRGINANNNERLLQSYGMVVIEMEGSGGERLQLAPGKQASITMPIGSALQASAPDSIPLWYFDETIGMWKEEGKAVRQGNAYMGNVSHFSFWNWDVPVTLINYTATFNDHLGNPLPFCRVSIKRPNGEIRYGAANQLGVLNGYLPSNEVLVMSVYGTCSSILLMTDTIGPFQTNVNAGTITVNTANYVVPTRTITGTVMGCNNLPLSTGFVQMELGGALTRTPITSGGSFSFSVQSCNGGTQTAVLHAFDTATGLSSPPKYVVVNASQVDAGQLTIVCSNILTGSISLTIDSTRIGWASSASDSLYGLRYYDQPIISYSSRITYQPTPLLANSPYMSFTFNGPGNIGPLGISSPTTFLLTSFQYLPNGTANPATGYTLSATSMGIAPVVVTVYGPVGNYIQGSFNAYAERNGIAVPVICSFRVKRVA